MFGVLLLLESTIKDYSTLPLSWLYMVLKASFHHNQTAPTKLFRVNAICRLCMVLKSFKMSLLEGSTKSFTAIY